MEKNEMASNIKKEKSLDQYLGIYMKTKKGEKT